MTDEAISLEHMTELSADLLSALLEVRVILRPFAVAQLPWAEKALKLIDAAVSPSTKRSTP